MFCRETSVFFVCLFFTHTNHASTPPSLPSVSSQKPPQILLRNSMKNLEKSPDTQIPMWSATRTSLILGGHPSTPNSQPYRTRRIRCTDPKPLAPSLSRSELFIWAALGNCFGLFGWFNVVADRCMRATTQWTVWLCQIFVYLHVKTKLNYM